MALESGQEARGQQGTTSLLCFLWNVSVTLSHTKKKIASHFTTKHRFQEACSSMTKFIQSAHQRARTCLPKPKTVSKSLAVHPPWTKNFLKILY